MITIPEKMPSQWWRTTTVRATGVVHMFAPTGLTCCGHVAIRECVATGVERKCVRCEEALARLTAALRPCEAAE